MSIEKPKNKPQQIKIEFNEESTNIEYSNFVVVTHSAAEFVLDYIRVLPGMAKAKVKSRIIMSPMHVKTLMFALQDNIKKFEDKFGEIKVLNEGGNMKIVFNKDYKKNTLIGKVEIEYNAELELG